MSRLVCYIDDEDGQAIICTHDGECDESCPDYAMHCPRYCKPEIFDPPV